MDLIMSLIPVILMIILVVITKKVIMSISVGIILGSLISHNFNVLASAQYIGSTLWGILTDFSWYMPIVGFLLILGVITAYLTISGSTKAFADWAVSKIANKRSAQYLAWILGIIIFIDDYFNALVIGEISKPITDRYKISRAKLAYIIDSTSAPVVILLPISTWGAYTIGILTKVFNKIDYTAYSGTAAFWKMIPMQFYAITALLMVFLTIRFDINIFKMKNFEAEAAIGNDITCANNESELTNIEVETTKGTKWSLIITITSLIASILLFMLQAAGWDVSNMLSVEMSLPMFKASIVSTIIALIFALSTREISGKVLVTSTFKGMYSMLSASVILILAWTLVAVIGKLETGKYLADFIISSNMHPGFLPPILFIVGSIIAFMTGTSWGTFGLLLPIAGDILAASDPTMILPAMAAVLSGAILGDHCSPISDTTVLSATGARSKLESHFISQLPYAVVAGVISVIAFTIFSFTHTLLLSYGAILALFVVYVLIGKRLSRA